MSDQSTPITINGVTLADSYAYECDPGHGWVAVPLSELVALGIASKITPYSYIDRAAGVAWLEEDCDLSTFVYARWPEDTSPRMSAALKIRHVEHTRIRDLPSYTFTPGA